MESGESVKKPTKKLGESTIALIDTVTDICGSCGDRTMKETSNYLKMSIHRGFGGLKAKTYGKTAFWYGFMGKKHFRLVGIAVREDSQGKGLGGLMLVDIIRECEEAGIREITLRTHKEGRALTFWRRQGAVVTGENGDDYEMKITF